MALLCDILLAVVQKPALRHPIAISLGAIAGALSRYYITLWVAHRFGAAFPYGTLLINLTGAWGMGLFTTLLLEHALPLSPEMRLLIGVGFLGSYTTFSTYELEAMNLLRARGVGLALSYWAGSAVLGAVSLYGGILTARGLR